MNGRGSDEGRAHLPAARQARQGHPSLTHSLSLALARDNHGDSDSDVQPDTVVEKYPPSNISSSSPAPSSPSLFPREAHPASQTSVKKKGQGSEQFLTLSYIIPHSPNPATSCLLGPLGDLINFPISNRTPQISNPPPVQPQFFEKWKGKKKGRFQRTGL